MIFSPWQREARQGTPKNDFFFQVPGRAPRDNKGTTKDVEGQPQCQNTCQGTLENKQKKISGAKDVQGAAKHAKK